jgi:hypothetical protein
MFSIEYDGIHYNNVSSNNPDRISGNDLITLPHVRVTLDGVLIGELIY